MTAVTSEIKFRQSKIYPEFGYASTYGHGHVICGHCSDNRMLLHARELLRCCRCNAVVKMGFTYTVTEDDDGLVCGQLSFEELRKGRV